MLDTKTNALNAASMEYIDRMWEHAADYARREAQGMQAMPTPTPVEHAPSPKFTPTTEGMKYDNDKPRLDLIDPEFLEGLGRILGFGAAKYAAHNWRNGIDASRLIAAAYRHLGAINKGEDLDPESGDHHAYHLGCCVMFLAWTLQHKPERDDRFKGNQA